MMNEEKLRKIISDCFVRLKEKFYEENTIEEHEDDTNLHILSQRDLIEALPPSSIKLIEVINDSVDSKYKKGFLIRYDYMQEDQDTKIDFFGSISSEDIELEKFVCNKFKLDERYLFELKKDMRENFTDFATWEQNQNWCLQFIAGDI